MNVDKLVLNKLSGNHSKSAFLDDFDIAVCFLSEKIGYETVMNLTIPEFSKFMEYYKMVVEEEKKAFNKRK